MIKRGEIYLIDFKGRGSEQIGLRPAVIIQNDVGNKYSKTTIVVPITSQNKKEIPTHVCLGKDGGLLKPSVAMCEQMQVVDKIRILKKIGEISEDKIQEMDMLFDNLL